MPASLSSFDATGNDRVARHAVVQDILIGFDVLDLVAVVGVLLMYLISVLVSGGRFLARRR